MNKAYKMFDDEEQLQYCMGVAEEAKETLQAKLEEKRKLAKKDGKTRIEEDDPIKVFSQGFIQKFLLGGETKILPMDLIRLA